MNNLLCGIHKEYIAYYLSIWQENGDKTEPWRTPKFIANSADQQSFHLTYTHNSQQSAIIT